MISEFRSGILLCIFAQYFSIAAIWVLIIAAIVCTKNCSNLQQVQTAFTQGKCRRGAIGYNLNDTMNYYPLLLQYDSL